jgi:hypothetical protein
LKHGDFILLILGIFPPTFYFFSQRVSCQATMTRSIVTQLKMDFPSTKLKVSSSISHSSMLSSVMSLLVRFLPCLSLYYSSFEFTFYSHISKQYSANWSTMLVGMIFFWLFLLILQGVDHS